jgi:hypothetical protein
VILYDAGQAKEKYAKQRPVGAQFILQLEDADTTDLKPKLEETLGQSVCEKGDFFKFTKNHLLDELCNVPEESFGVAFPE